MLKHGLLKRPPSSSLPPHPHFVLRCDETCAHARRNLSSHVQPLSTLPAKAPLGQPLGLCRTCQQFSLPSGGRSCEEEALAGLEAVWEGYSRGSGAWSLFQKEGTALHGCISLILLTPYDSPYIWLMRGMWFGGMLWCGPESMGPQGNTSDGCWEDRNFISDEAKWWVPWSFQNPQLNTWLSSKECWKKDHFLSPQPYCHSKMTSHSKIKAHRWRGYPGSHLKSF